ncbi:MAG: hypothetical protein ACTHLE_12670 [Agriterribacter sp.]
MNRSSIPYNKKEFARIAEEEDYALTRDEQLNVAATHPRRTLIYFFAMVLECFIPPAFRK